MGPCCCTAQSCTPLLLLTTTTMMMMMMLVAKVLQEVPPGTAAQTAETACPAQNASTVQPLLTMVLVLVQVQVLKAPLETGAQTAGIAGQALQMSVQVLLQTMQAPVQVLEAEPPRKEAQTAESVCQALLHTWAQKQVLKALLHT
jgi:hypothetical protein